LEADEVAKTKKAEEERIELEKATAAAAAQ